MDPKKQIANDITPDKVGTPTEAWLSILIEAAIDAYLKEDISIKDGVIKYKK